MPHRILVIGASLGGWDALPELVSGLPSDLNAAVFVVLHMSPGGPSYLADRLNSLGRLPAASAADGEEIQPRRVYVAVPDRHLMLESGRVRLSRGPRESHARPSIDVLFRSAAYVGGPRVIGIVLTGMLDDGTAGLWAIKDRGGIAIVQSPTEARYPSMPLSALKHVRVDHALQVAEMPRILSALIAQPLEGEIVLPPNEKLEIENRIALEDNAIEVGARSLGSPSVFTCPECHGSMVAINDGSIRRFRCHTGHGFTEGSLSEKSLARVEETLWSALAQMEERVTLLDEIKANPPDPLLDDDATQSRQLAKRIRELLANRAFSGAQ